MMGRQQVYITQIEAHVALEVLTRIAAYDFGELNEHYGFGEAEVDAWQSVMAKLRPVANQVGKVRCDQCGVLWRAEPGDCSCGGTRRPEAARPAGGRTRPRHA